MLYFKPILVEEIVSPINGKIQVFKFLGEYRLHVNGLIQSGGILKGIWLKALKKVKSSKLKVQSCLILGLGGGTATEIVSHFWPEAKIVGVEIDPVIIKLGKKYFGLNKISNLEIICNDAIKTINNLPAVRQGQQLAISNFDLILVDLYIGDEVPQKAESKEFLKNLKRIVKNDGLVIFNRLFYKEHKQKAQDFIKKAEKFFPRITLGRTPSNLLIFCS